jgi:hypothetical protein
MTPGIPSLSQCGAHAVLFALHLPSRMAVNRVVWAGGILLQILLLAVVLWRGIVRRFPAFAALIAFYPARAILFYFLAGRLDADAYDTLFHALAMVEIALQALLAIEIARRLARAMGGWTWRRGVAALVLAAVALALTAVTFSLLPEKQLAGRTQIAMGFVMIEMLAVAWKQAGAGNLFLIPAGFAAFAGFQLLSLAGSAYAATHHEAGAYLAWSYLPACGYLAVVVFWIAALKGQERPVKGRPGLARETAGLARQDPA